MPLADSSSVICISSLGSSWVQEDEEPDFKAEGFDTLSVVLFRDYGAVVKTPEQVAAEFPVGMRLYPGRDFWVVDRKPTRRSAANHWSIALTLFGLADAARPVKISLNGSADQQGLPGSTTIWPPLSDFVVTTSKGTILESYPTMTASYVLIGRLPPTENVGRAGTGYQTPPLNIPIRPTVWTYLADPSWHFPAGWVLNNMPAQILSGTDTPVSFVQEEWIYRRPFTP